MNTNLFRKSNIDRVNSPEQLNDYIRVANPSVWIVLTAIVFLLLGVVIWGVFGTVETKIDTTVVVQNGNAVAYVSVDNLSSLNEGLTVRVAGVEGIIESLNKVPVEITKNFSSYFLYLSGLQIGDFVYAVNVSLTGVEDGIYSSSIVVDSINPIYFVIH